MTSLTLESSVGDGRLIRPLAQIADVGVEYRLVYADDQVRRRPDVTHFTRWLIDGIATADGTEPPLS